ncbi:hypothetical protein Q1695_013421 [Nippostrongylus brasiliensis]|nr:hypothetical protein Q1695_013421 [Nippostrongylus brasiliensis]
MPEPLSTSLQETQEDVGAEKVPRCGLDGVMAVMERVFVQLLAGSSSIGATAACQTETPLSLSTLHRHRCMVFR